jgi:hypothetical protein
MSWGRDNCAPAQKTDEDLDKAQYVIQLVRQVNYGPIEFKRYFARMEGTAFVEVSERDLIAGNFKKLNTYRR